MKLGHFDLTTDGTFIIAELSANHGGSLETALATVKAAKAAGANAIKLQTYTADTLTLDCDKEDFIIKGDTLWDGRKLYDLYQEAYTPWEWHEALFDCAKKEGLLCFSSPFDKNAVDFLEQFDPFAYKIASFEITDHALIRYAASKGRPMIISTGIATYEEIEETVAICKKEGNHDIILLKCTSAYPAPLEDANLVMIQDIAKTFGVVTGFSDHTLGITAPITAVALGAKVIEKHFILDASIDGPDADFSLDTPAFTKMVQAVRDAEKLLGTIDYSMNEKKKKSRQFARSLYVSKDIKKGEVITEDNIRSVRPGYGLHPRHLHAVIGKEVIRDMTFGTPLAFKDIKG